MHHWRLEPLTEGQQLVVCAGASGTAQDRHPASTIEQGRQSIKIWGRWRRHWPATLGGGASAAACRATSPGIATTETPLFPTASRIAISSMRGISLAQETSSQ